MAAERKIGSFAQPLSFAGRSCWIAAASEACSAKQTWPAHALSFWVPGGCNANERPLCAAAFFYRPRVLDRCRERGAQNRAEVATSWPKLLSSWQLQRKKSVRFARPLSFAGRSCWIIAASGARSTKQIWQPHGISLWVPGCSMKERPLCAAAFICRPLVLNRCR